ncbi:23S rRNA (uracil(1939)-C(5))-methyltransferase RlmD [Mammaliicoccus sciuri]|uniref:23S rRNA (uracil(1939)-C(5))-methyltransferase RlmD n=1 Tax=Mammaliicoccus sciuri TaxID=1296 RepID=UPI0019D3CFFE|nr:23S rRNA (uracil(1939)-C(5))-methyltransferase RlmD [Mammaliicoccus sciuri]QSN68666.1 23S rRNA (uracil(1939)-C(5))-methyltransferase RlmD [Mammaliicoccus sciuri]UIU23409.1 23S rRNA (uracil(1939)-C(5))-methyltransferase RlmD [Mammaliicoccus sciuri]UIU26317.1 23S rRNA (uracil(1939)-C(5))-methyltransferase RlmD [Mammaliicoccus sciuri]
MNVSVKVGQKFPLTIKRLGINGEGIGYYKKKITFVEGLLPGEVGLVQVVKAKPNFIEAKVVKIRERSKERVKPKCKVYDICGGCQLQHLNYDAQLLFKSQIVKDALTKYAKNIPTKIVKPTIGMDNPWGYRNKNQFPVQKKGNQLIAGLYEKDSHQLIDIKKCPVQDKRTIQVTNELRNILTNLQVKVCRNPNKEQGLRYIVTRVAKHSQQIQVTLVCTDDQLKYNQSLIDQIMNLSFVESLSININKEKTSRVLGNQTIHISGKQQITETLGQYYYDLSPDSFFQLNPEQATKMYGEIETQANLTGNESVVDAFCGTGTIGIWLSQNAKEVRGMDIIKEGIDDAKKNAELNNRHNVHYEVGDAYKVMDKWIKESFKPDVITVDPPRTGLGIKAVELIKSVHPKTFVYTSCNPSTLAKDLAHLSKKYKVVSMQPIDMFPQTAQVEVVAKLVAK